MAWLRFSNARDSKRYRGKKSHTYSETTTVTDFGSPCKKKTERGQHGDPPPPTSTNGRAVAMNAVNRE